MGWGYTVLENSVVQLGCTSRFKPQSGHPGFSSGYQGCVCVVKASAPTTPILDRSVTHAFVASCLEDDLQNER